MPTLRRPPQGFDRRQRYSCAAAGSMPVPLAISFPNCLLYSTGIVGNAWGDSSQSTLSELVETLIIKDIFYKFRIQKSPLSHCSL